MADTQELVRQARALGEQVARHPRVVAFHEARAALERDAAALELLQDYQRQTNRVQELEHAGKPIEVADKHMLRELQQRMASQDAVKRLMRAQADYVELMNEIHQAMDEPVSRLASKDASE